MRILIQGLNKRNRRIRNTYYISGFSVKLFSAGFMIHLNKIEMHVKVSKAFNIRPLSQEGLEPTTSRLRGKRLDLLPREVHYFS